MKNAFVLVDHLGDNGMVTTGMILSDVGTKRYDHLEKRGLVREATADEIKDGFKPDFIGEKAAQEPVNKKAAEPANKAR